MRGIYAKTLLLLGALAVLSGCAVTQPTPYDYTAFRESKPASIVILPPVNKSPDIKASYSVLSQLSQPLGEAGYYVLPVALVNETFKQNGLTSPEDIQQAPPAKVREIFGADAALYVEVSRYGTSYQVIRSETAVAASAKLVDLRTGALLWEGSAAASTAEQQQNNQGGLVGMLVSAVINQIADSLTDRGHQMAGIAGYRLLTVRPNGMLYGPHSPQYQKDLATR